VRRRLGDVVDLILFISKKNCEECPQAEKIVRAIAKTFKKDLHVDVLDMDNKGNRQTASQLHITAAPALLLDGKPIFPDKFPTQDELEKFISERLDKSGAMKTRRERSRWWSISGLPEQWGPER